VLCGRIASNLWGLPKGTPDAGESLLDTALREVHEETGLDVEAGPKLGIVRYWFVAGGVRYRKQVHYWLMEPLGGDVANHDHEFDRVEWRSLTEGLTILTFENERRMVAKAAARIGEPA
jgi:8-oxo-dGTP pyrophosphatase MutT (NUDIX family)